jgi:carboxypeptidase Taq
MGYDFDRGRQDIAPHPFTISFGVDDVRVTTRIDEKDLSNMTWSCIHEGGHALYEQGLDGSEYGLPSGSAISLAIHESQSRLWENNVGRSLEYWKYHYPTLQKIFNKNLENVSLKKFYRAINNVEPGFIRTEADELNYHLHIMVRYEIEKIMMSENVDAHQLKTLWNEKYKEYLGLDVKEDNLGILQDVHWAHGSIGYFPTYSLGSFYAAQFFHQAEKDIPKLKKQIKKGDTSQLLDWLRTNIHRKGRSVEAEELCTNLTGEGLNFDYFKNYVEKKYLKLL